MKTIFADFNAMTESEQVCLTTRGSQHEIDARGIQEGDLVWLSDGELVVGAKVAVDPRYGVVGVPVWDTLINLEDAENADFSQAWSAFQRLSQSPTRTREDETRTLQLLETIERKAPQSVRAVIPAGYLHFRRAGALFLLGHVELGREENELALLENPNSAAYLSLHLELLRRSDLPKALQEAQRLADDPIIGARVLAAAINVFATYLDGFSNHEFEARVGMMLDWIERFQRLTGVENIPVSVRSQVWFNSGMALLRISKVDDARNSFSRILQLNPRDKKVQRAIELDRFDEEARQLAKENQYRELPMFAA
jgi:tetratricopeptide (TPR) repeat protein